VGTCKGKTKIERVSKKAIGFTTTTAMTGEFECTACWDETREKACLSLFSLTHVKIGRLDSQEVHLPV
jgi:hypothetical protein